MQRTAHFVRALAGTCASEQAFYKKKINTLEMKSHWFIKGYRTVYLAPTGAWLSQHANHQKNWKENDYTIYDYITVKIEIFVSAVDALHFMFV